MNSIFDNLDNKFREQQDEMFFFIYELFEKHGQFVFGNPHYKLYKAISIDLLDKIKAVI